MKGAIVDVRSGELTSERIKLSTPQPATPEAMIEPFLDLIKMQDWEGLVGCGFPAILKNGVAYSASNIDKQWIGQNVEEWFAGPSKCRVKAINDADAAGIAEYYFGAGKDSTGAILLITIGSGLGTALIYNGQIVPNTEFGHVFLEGHREVAEKYASNNARKAADLSWEEWGKRFNEYLHHLERLLSPDQIILGGGISKKFELYKQFLNPQTEVVPASLLNNAGIAGAAWHAYYG